MKKLLLILALALFTHPVFAEFNYAEYSHNLAKDQEKWDKTCEKEGKEMQLQQDKFQNEIERLLRQEDKLQKRNIKYY